MVTPPSRTPRSLRRVFDAAAKMAGDHGLDALTLTSVAEAAGVSIGLLRYHFRSKEHLLIEAQRATFREVHKRFEARFDEGDVGPDTAFDALDALWSAVREMHAWAPFMVHTLSCATRDPELGSRFADFNAESLTRVELGLMRVFPADLHRLALPPDRLARAVRTGVYGLVVELAAARTDEERDKVDQTYRDVRGLLAMVLLAPAMPAAVSSTPVLH